MQRPSEIKCNQCGSERTLKLFSSVTCSTCSSKNVMIRRTVPVEDCDVEQYQLGQDKHAEIDRLRKEIYDLSQAYENQCRKRKYLELAKLIVTSCGDDVELFTTEYERFRGRKCNFDNRLCCLDNLRADSTLNLPNLDV